MEGTTITSPVKKGDNEKQKWIPTWHSPVAYSIIKTIHLMNCTNPDTLTPVMKIRRPVAPERGKFSSVRIRRIQNKIENLQKFRRGFVHEFGNVC
jgi:hypothetical protein